MSATDELYAVIITEGPRAPMLALSGSGGPALFRHHSEASGFAGALRRHGMPCKVARVTVTVTEAQ